MVCSNVRFRISATISTVAVVLFILGVALAPKSQAGVSDLLYYNEELRIKNPSRSIARIINGLGDRFMMFIDVDGKPRVWDFVSGQQHILPGNIDAGNAFAVPNERRGNFIRVSRNGEFWSTRALSLKPVKQIVALNRTVQAIYPAKDSNIIVAVSGKNIFAVDVVEKLVSKFPMKSPSASSFAVSGDGRHFVYGDAGSISFLNFETKKTSTTVLEGDDLKQIIPFYLVSGATAFALVSNSGLVRIFTLSPGGKFIAKQNFKIDADYTAIAIESEEAIFWSKGGKLRSYGVSTKRRRTLHESKSPITFLHLIPNSGIILLIAKSGSMELFDRSKRKTLATAISTENGWAVVDRNKRFDGSEVGVKQISWLVSELDLNLENFSRQFFEPGLLLHYLGFIELDLSDTGTNKKFPIPPTIDKTEVLLNVANTGTTVILATARNINGEIRQIDVFLNGKKVSARSLISSKSEKHQGIIVRSVGYSVEPVTGINTVRVSAIGGDQIEGPSKTFTFVTKGQSRKNLKVLAIGIDDYNLPDLELNYAQPDARSIVQAFSRRKGFANIEVNLVIGRNATKRKILSAMRKIMGTAAAGDTVVVYLAGHGVSIDDQWYFLPVDVSSTDPPAVKSEAITSSEMAKIFETSRAQNILLMIDACQAGGVVYGLRGLAQSRTYQKMARRLGFAIIAATREDQLAGERKVLGHGIFTSAVLSGLDGKADSVSDGRITVKELASYVSKETAKLAMEHINEIQIPLAFVPYNDFVVSNR